MFKNDYIVRQVWDGVVYRLFPTVALAQSEANMLNMRNNHQFRPVEHPSMNGYVVSSDATGQSYDAMGLLPRKTAPMAFSQ